jgi:hypothetical protein
MPEKQQLTGATVLKYAATPVKTMNKKILSELGNYLLAHCGQIRGEWLEAIEQNPDISSLVHLKDEEELADHLPELCQNLAKLR